MATTSLGRLTLDLVAQIGQFVGPMNQAERKAKESTDKMNKAFASFKDQMNQSLNGSQIGSVIEGISGKLGSLQGGLLSVTAAAAGMAVGGVVVAAGGLSVLAIETAKNNVEMMRFAAISNTSIATFQGLAGAAQTFGITQEQLSDQLKDFNEKLGEFASVGAGGATDFFEQIAVKTEGGAEGAKKLAEEMSKMDGVAALQTYVDKLEEAGVNQQQMSFYLESMGSDLTKIAPLLVNGGQLWKDYQKALEDAGVITGQEAAEQSIVLAAQTESLQIQFGALKNQLAQAVMPALSSLIGYFLDGSGKGGQFAGIIEAVGIAAKGAAVLVVGLAGGIKNLVTLISGAMNLLGNLGQTAVNVWNAPTFKDKGRALVDGFMNNGNILVNTAKSVVDTTKKTYGTISNVVSSQAGEYDALTQSIINNQKAQQDWAKKTGKGVTSGIAQNKELNPDAKKSASKTKTKGKVDNSAEKARREQDQIEKAQQSIVMQYADEELKLKLRYEEDKKNISKAFAKDSANEILYLGKAKQTYDLDVSAYKQAQKEKYDSYRNDFLSKMADAEDAISLSSIANKYGKDALEFQVASLNVSARKSKAGEYDDYTNSVNQINRDYNTPELEAQRYELLEQAKAAHIANLKAMDVEYHDSAKQLIEDQHQSQLGLYSTLLSQASSVWGSMTQMVKDSAGEQSGAYKAMFLMQQSFAIASAIVSAHLSAVQVAADATIPFFGAKVLASKAMLAMGYANAGMIAGQTIAGVFHGGVDYVPKESSYFLDKGERVLSPRQNSDLTRYLGDRRQQQSGVMMNVEVINQVSGAKVETQQIDENRVRIIVRDEVNRFVPNQIADSNSKISKSMQRHTTAKRERA